MMLQMPFQNVNLKLTLTSRTFHINQHEKDLFLLQEMHGGWTANDTDQMSYTGKKGSWNLSTIKDSTMMTSCFRHKQTVDF